jgi:hypothetical protein
MRTGLAVMDALTVHSDSEVAANTRPNGIITPCYEDYRETNKAIARAARSMGWNESDGGPD